MWWSPGADAWPQRPVGMKAPCHLSPSLPRIVDQRFEKVSYFVFGDFNFRLDSKSVVEVGPQLPARLEPTRV